MTTAVDVVVVGGGIAGASLARALALGGLGVTVLEATEQFPDRVRGESMQAWGVREARELGVEDVLLAAGAHVAPTWRQYFPNGDDPRDIPMNFMVPGIGGSLNLGHPGACQALLDAATAEGVTVLRGVSDVRISAGTSPVVHYEVDGQDVELRPSLVVGADGRRSVTRRALGITLERQPETSYIAGLLLDDLVGVPDDHDVLVGEDDRWFLLFHQGGSRAPGVRLHRALRPASLRRTGRFVPVPRSVFRVELPVERAGRRGDPRRSVRDVCGRRHVVRRALRRRRRAHR